MPFYLHLMEIKYGSHGLTVRKPSQPMSAIWKLHFKIKHGYYQRHLSLAGCLTNRCIGEAGFEQPSCAQLVATFYTYIRQHNCAVYAGMVVVFVYNNTLETNTKAQQRQKQANITTEEKVRNSLWTMLTILLCEYAIAHWKCPWYFHILSYSSNSSCSATL